MNLSVRRTGTEPGAGLLVAQGISGQGHLLNSANGLKWNNYNHTKPGLHDGMRRWPDDQAWQVIIGGVLTDAANGRLLNGQSFYG